MGKASQQCSASPHGGAGGSHPVTLAGLTAGPSAGISQWNKGPPRAGRQAGRQRASPHPHKSLGGCATFEATAQFWVALVFPALCLTSEMPKYTF